MNPQTNRLLTNVYKSSKMGMHTLKAAIDRVSEKSIKINMQNQYNEYYVIAKEAEEYLINEGVHPEDNGLLSKINASKTVEMSIGDISKMTQVIINDSKSYVSNIEWHLQSCINADKQSRNLAERFLNQTNNSIKVFKDYL